MDYDTRFSAHASLTIVGQQMNQMGIWETIQEKVAIKQKIIRHQPLDKLKDCFIGILAGGQGLVEINTRVRPDRALQRAFGRDVCAAVTNRPSARLWIAATKKMWRNCVKP